MVEARVPPHDLDAEGAVLSAVLGPPYALDEVRDTLKPSDFYSDANRRIFEAACEVDDSGGGVDTVAVAGRLRDAGRLEQIGGTAYLVQLVDGTPYGNLETHCRTVASKARVRRIILAGQSIAAEGYGEIRDVGEWSQRAEQVVFEAAESSLAQWPTEQASQVIARVFGDIQARSEDRARCRASYVPMPWPSLREFFPGGLARSKVHVIAGRPSMGKSAFASEFVRQSVSDGLGALYLSVEMGRDELVARMLSAHSEVPLTTILHGAPTAMEWGALTAAGTELSRLPISVAYRPGATIQQIRSTIRREAARMRNERNCELTMVVVDYLQIVRGPFRQSREETVSEISRELLAIAGEFNVTIIAVSQLSREVEKRPDKRPQLSDLRESGSIEQDAYSVMFLYRDDYYDEKSKWPGLCEVAVAKNRNGGTGMARLTFTRRCCRFQAETEPGQGAWDWNNCGN